MDLLLKVSGGGVICILHGAFSVRYSNPLDDFLLPNSSDFRLAYFSFCTFLLLCFEWFLICIFESARSCYMAVFTFIASQCLDVCLFFCHSVCGWLSVCLCVLIWPSVCMCFCLTLYLLMLPFALSWRCSRQRPCLHTSWSQAYSKTFWRCLLMSRSKRLKRVKIIVYHLCFSNHIYFMQFMSQLQYLSYQVTNAFGLTWRLWMQCAS